jgi:uncharacterized protein (TIGR03083 family)
MTELEFFVAAWRHSAAAIAALDLTEAEWDTATDLPRWAARDVLAHLVHLERVLLDGEPPVSATDGAPVPPDYTEAGVAALRGTSPADLMADYVRLVHARAAGLVDLPEDGTVAPVRTPAGAGWDTATLLRNRAYDTWVHEQDIRRAVDRPGNLDSPGAQLTVLVGTSALAYIVGKKAQAPRGTAVRFVVTGEIPVDLTIEVGDDGRGRVAPEGTEATTTLTMTTEEFVILTTGRRTSADLDVEIWGDEALGQRVLDSMTITF